MPFILVKHIDGSINALEHTYFMKDGEGANIGDVLKQDANGRLTKATGTDVPEFVSYRKQAAETPSKTPMAVIRITAADEFETTATAAIANSGGKVTIHTDGAQVTATTTGGVFLISDTDGDKKVRGYFRR